MSRTKVRELATIGLYQMDIHGSFKKEKAFEVLEDKDKKVVENQLYNDIIDKFILNKEEVDKKIESGLINWKIDRISKMDLAILRVAVVELEYIKENPFKVIVNEAINNSKKYGDEASGKFINGVLGNFDEANKNEKKASSKKQMKKNNIEVVVRKKRKVEATNETEDI